MEMGFVKGMTLCENYYFDIVKNIVKSNFPQLKFSAGLIDYGSEVLGFDTQTSTDHDWGPRVNLFIEDQDYRDMKHKLATVLDMKLPEYYGTYLTSFTKQGGSEVRHRVEVFTPKEFFSTYLGFDISKKLSLKEWLLFPEQKLRTIRSGKIFEDNLGIENIRSKLYFYPKDVWLYIMACDWQKIGQEEPFIGRCGDVEDELGSAIIATRIVNTIMHLCFMLEKQFAPYSKWFGTAFASLNCATDLNPVLREIISSNDWKTREYYLTKVYEYIAKKHNRLGITKTIKEKVTYFHSREYKVINGSAVADSLRSHIHNDELRKLSYMGSINQITYTTDILESNRLIKKLENIYV